MEGGILMTMDEYIGAYTGIHREMLEILRNTISHVSPGAEEIISYSMPAFRHHGILVYFAAHKEHIGFYPANLSVFEVFKDDLQGYATSKGTIRFPIDKGIPILLVEKIVTFRLQQNLAKAALKTKSKTKTKQSG